jgi:hypothetical protein
MRPRLSEERSVAFERPVLAGVAVGAFELGEVAEATLARLRAAAPQSPAAQQLRAGIDRAKAGAPAETSEVKAGK